MIHVVATHIPILCGAQRASRDQSGQDGQLPEVGRQVQRAGGIWVQRKHPVALGRGLNKVQDLVFCDLWGTVYTLSILDA